MVESLSQIEYTICIHCTTVHLLYTWSMRLDERQKKAFMENICLGSTWKVTRIDVLRSIKFGRTLGVEEQLSVKVNWKVSRSFGLVQCVSIYKGRIKRVKVALHEVSGLSKRGVKGEVTGA